VINAVLLKHFSTQAKVIHLGGNPSALGRFTGSGIEFSDGRRFSEFEFNPFDEMNTELTLGEVGNVSDRLSNMRINTVNGKYSANVGEVDLDCDNNVCGFIRHGIMSPQVHIDDFGSDFSRVFLNIEKTGENKFLYGNFHAMNSSYDRFNNLLPENSPLRINVNFYDSAEVFTGDPGDHVEMMRSFINQLANSPEGRIDWPFGNEDIFQIHDMGTHSTMGLLDANFINAAKGKSQEVVQFINFMKTKNVNSNDPLIEDIIRKSSSDMESVGALGGQLQLNNSSHRDIVLPKMDVVDNMSGTSINYLENLVGENFRRNRLWREYLSERVEPESSNPGSFTAHSLRNIALEKKILINEAIESNRFGS